MKKFKIGDRVWWYDPYGTLRWGIIYDIKDGHAAIHEEGKTGSQTGAPLDRCHATKDDCIRAETDRITAQTEAYQTSIKDVRDLVKFLFTHDVHSEFRDYEAEVAARKRAKELLDLDV